MKFLTRVTGWHRSPNVVTLPWQHNATATPATPGGVFTRKPFPKHDIGKYIWRSTCTPMSTPSCPRTQKRRNTSQRRFPGCRLLSARCFSVPKRNTPCDHRHRHPIMVVSVEEVASSLVREFLSRKVSEEPAIGQPR